ncbi:hypothetical protein [Accumulibacter sp.]|uniref:hypothetical protein n=1 Tax=Accumulibacter sp. TaxID=2053492 RepID=UPI00258B2CD9|nr:hypothetical protein [Accumulibacter sp.]
MTGADRLRSLAPANKTLLRRLPLTTDESPSSVSQTRLAVHAQSFGLTSLLVLSVFFMEIGEEGIGFWNFFGAWL